MSLHHIPLFLFLSISLEGATLPGRVHEESREVSYIFLSFSFLPRKGRERGAGWRYIFLHTYSSPSLSYQCKKRKRGGIEDTYSSTYIPLLLYLTSVRRGRGAGLKIHIPPHIFLSFSILPV
jgi:hypothetical protein